MNKPLISIVIPARNTSFTIKKCIESLLCLDYDNFEIIIIDDGSNDDTLTLIKSFSNIKLISTEGVGPSKARNLGIRQAAGEFVAFTDADCIVHRDWLSQLLNGFDDNKVAGVGGIQKSPGDDSWFAKLVHEFLVAFGFISGYMQPGKTIKDTDHNPTCNVIYRKAILLEMGGFLEGIWPGEDVELDYRIKKKGYRLVFNPLAIVEHYRPDNFKKFTGMMFRYGQSQGILVKKYGFFRKIHSVPFLSLAVVLIFVYNFIFGLVFTLVTILGIYMIGLQKAENKLIVLLLFLSAILTWNLGFLHGLFKKIK